MHPNRADQPAQASPLEQYHRYFDRQASPFVEVATTPPASGPFSNAVAQRRYRPHPAIGSGWIDLHEFSNGLTIGRLHCRFEQGMQERYRQFPDSIRLSILLGGHERIVHQHGDALPGRAGDIFVRHGDPGPLCSQVPGGVAQRGLALDLPRRMVETLAEQGVDVAHLGDPGRCTLLRPTGELAARLLHTCRRMMALQADAHLLARLELESLGLDLLLQLLRAGDLRTAPTIEGRLHARWQAALDQAMDILHAEWNRPLTIAQLARRAGLNECYLKELFRQRTGQTIASYQRALRMRHAHEMLEGGRSSLQQVAYACGYARADKFSQAFRRHYGVAPSALRAGQGGFP